MTIDLINQGRRYWVGKIGIFQPSISEIRGKKSLKIYASYMYLLWMLSKFEVLPIQFLQDYVVPVNV